jgi:hypothetical protein
MKDYFTSVFVGFTNKRVKEIFGEKLEVHGGSWNDKSYKISEFYEYLILMGKDHIDKKI